MTRRDMSVMVGVNILWLMNAPLWVGLWPVPLRMLVVMVALALVPGLAWDWMWTGASRSRAVAHVVGRLLVASTGWFILALVGFRLMSLAPDQVSMWWVMGGVSNLGLFLGRWRQRRLAPARWCSLREATVGLALALGSLWLFSYMAVRVVPPLQDQDMEVQGTGYGLVTRLEPYFLSDRGVRFFFAHPPLVHVSVAGSFLYQGQLDALKIYDTLTREAVAPTDPKSALPLEAQFDREPRLLETRTPSVVFGALTVALLGVWTARRSRRLWVGVLVAVAYATSPEVLVRSSYGGYYAATALAALLMLWSVANRRQGAGDSHGWVPGAIAAWAALVNHKLVVLPIGLIVGRMVGGGGVIASVMRLRAVWVGFLLGTLVFWIYGLGLAPEDFVTDHLRYHLWDRVVHDNPLGYGGYLSVTGLWRQFGAHTAIVLLPLALVAGLTDVVWKTKPRDAALVWMLLGWIGVTAVVFSFADWRMTKHLAPIIVGLHVLLVPGRHAPRWRLIGAALTCLWLIAWNVRADLGLLRDFASLIVTPDW